MQFDGIRIEAIDYVFPDTALNNAELGELFPEWSIDRIFSKVGINTRYISGADETAVDLGVKAAESLLSRLPEARESIDALLFCTESPDYLIPPSAYVVQSRLALSNELFCMDYNLGCSGFVFGLSLAQGLVASGQANSILLVTADTYTKFIAPRDKSIRTIFGDAGTATLISKSENSPRGSFSFYADGSRARALMVPHSAMATPKEKQSDLEPHFNCAERGPENLYMNGPGIFQFTLDVVPPLLKRCLAKEALSMQDIDFVIMHQANAFMLETLRQKCNIPPNKFIVDMADGGNTVSCTIPIAFARALQANRIQRGQKILLAGFGVGLSAGAAAITF